MVLQVDNGGNWLSAETGNSSNELIDMKTVSSRNISITKGVLSYMTKKPISKMVIEAVKILSGDARGASLPAIIKWIAGNYAVSDFERLKMHVKKAVVKGLKTGTIVRSETSRGCLGTVGSFVLGKQTNRKQGSQKSGRKASSKMSNLNSNIHSAGLEKL